MAKNKGYVSIWRDIQDNDIWTSEPFSKGQAWIDLILMANHEEKTVVLGNDVIKAEVGSVITSELKLMDRWRWGKEKTRNYLKLLERLEMIERIPDHKKTYIVVKKYVEYQTTPQTAPNIDNIRNDKEYQTAPQTVSRPQADREQTVNHTQTITTNNYTITKNKEREKRVSQYGEYKNVILTDEELEKLRSDFPEMYLEKIEGLSVYMKSTGKSYKSHYATIRKWIIKDQKEGEKDGKSLRNTEEDEQVDRGVIFNPYDFL